MARRPSVLDLRWRPEHAYISGRRARHPEYLFDRFKPEADLPDALFEQLHRLALGAVVLWRGFLLGSA